MTAQAPFQVAIACGGTGGHLFPGLAVGEQLVRRGCAVTLLVSPKDVDQHAVKSASGMQIVTLPAVGLTSGRGLAFMRGFVRSYRAARGRFETGRPAAVLAMGGFTSAPPILAARRLGARTFLHESNTIPGRANRWLARMVDGAFVGFPQAAPRLSNRYVSCIGTPVRPQFQPRDPAACRKALGLDPENPVLLVMGGSQGARGINELVIRTLPLLAKEVPLLQVIHLTGPNDADKVQAACREACLRAVVHPFFAEMELALGAATVAVSRAGASSLAELAAMCVPSVLIPFPEATGNHQFHNARAYEETGAARVIEQRSATPEALSGLVLEMMAGGPGGERMRAALAKWHRPDAAERIAEMIFQSADQSTHGKYARDASGAAGTSATRATLGRAIVAFGILTPFLSAAPCAARFL